MALVCDMKHQSRMETEEAEEGEDLEDGEIEDDEVEDTATDQLQQQQQPPPAVKNAGSTNVAIPSPLLSPKTTSPRSSNNNSSVIPPKRSSTSDRKSGKHLTEAEKSVLQLRRRQRMQREQWEKWDKFKRGGHGGRGGGSSTTQHHSGHHTPQLDVVSTDDFASHIEKAIANVLKKDKLDEGQSSPSRDDRSSDDVGTGTPVISRKRKSREYEDTGSKRSRHHSVESISRELDGGNVEDPDMLNVRGGTPNLHHSHHHHHHHHQHHRHAGNNAATSGGADNSNSENSDDNLSSDDRRGGGLLPHPNISLAIDRRAAMLLKRENRKNRKRRRHEIKRPSIGGGGNMGMSPRDKMMGVQNSQLSSANELRDSQGVCVFFLQGKCTQDDCPYSHEAVPPMKLELCKFYVMGCCAKGDKCSYMHSEFPCKFYHTGLLCQYGEENCKFAHGRPLSEGLRQILFKHIETAPREILGSGFPRLTREESLQMINKTQHSLAIRYAEIEEDNGDTVLSTLDRKTHSPAPDVYDKSVPIPVELMSIRKNADSPTHRTESKSSKKDRSRSSRWQDKNNSTAVNKNDDQPQFGIQDQDMRVPSTGDIDMRKIPLADNGAEVNILAKPQLELFRRIQAKQVDPTPVPTASVNNSSNSPTARTTPTDDWYSDEDHDETNTKPSVTTSTVVVPQTPDDDDDEDDQKLTIECEPDDIESSIAPVVVPAPIKPIDVVEKLGDLSKIDISEEVTKLLSSISQKINQTPEINSSAAANNYTTRDPRQQASRNSIAAAIAKLEEDDSPKSPPSNSTAISIYEQGGLNLLLDDDSRKSTHGRPDVDLRLIGVDPNNSAVLPPFQTMLGNYTPAKEIDASLSSHSPLPWDLHEVDIPKPDYAGLRLNPQDAETSGDPRLRKIFRSVLSMTANKSSGVALLPTPQPSVGLLPVPASPPLVPQPNDATTTPQIQLQPRIDPRLQKRPTAPLLATPTTNELNFGQQLSILQGSAFFQSLTSNQKLLLNQELVQRQNVGPGTTGSDSMLSNLLTSLNLVPPTAQQQPLFACGAPSSQQPHQSSQYASSILASLGGSQQQPVHSGAPPGSFGPPNDLRMNQYDSDAVGPKFHGGNRGHHPRGRGGGGRGGLLPLHLASNRGNSGHRHPIHNSFRGNNNRGNSYRGGHHHNNRHNMNAGRSHSPA